MKIGTNRDINRDHKKLPVVKPDDTPKKVIHDLVGVTRSHNLKMLTEKHNDEKLAITFLVVGAGLITYHFW